ncbi:MAG: hypothetical protein NTZ90_15760 [Proteobacteria bacterium]|nr:hypothetical protein [Pseudomonadota bacterium]
MASKGHHSRGGSKAVRFGLALSIVAGLASASCSKGSSSASSLTAAVSATELLGDLPASGRSLFDRMTMVVVPGSQGPQYQQVVPYPFPALRAFIEGSSATPALATLLPRGRSLQRQAAGDQPFRFPRLVLAMPGEPRRQNDDFGAYNKDRLFLGHVEVANQIEVISFNDEVGRFEFQIVSDYGKGLKPQVRYANRALCLSCHQNGAPIFSQSPWDESIANTAISARVLAAVQADTYLGVQVRQFSNVPSEFQASVDRANLLVRHEQLWRDGCSVPAPLSAEHCRRLSLQLALSYALSGDIVDADYDQVSALYKAAWQAKFPTGLMIPSADLPNFNPLAPATHQGDTDYLSRLGVDIRGQLQQIARDSDVPLDAEPLRERTTPLATWTVTASDPARLIYALAATFSSDDLTALRSGLAGTTLAGPLDLMEAKGFFKRQAFDRCSILLALLPLLPQPLTRVRCGLDPAAALPPALATHGGSVKEDGGLSLMQSYCGGCHTSGPYPFLAGDSRTDVTRQLVERRDELFKRLDWDSAGAGFSMPPAASNQRQALQVKPEDRTAILDFLRSL